MCCVGTGALLLAPLRHVLPPRLLLFQLVLTNFAATVDSRKSLQYRNCI